MKLRHKSLTIVILSSAFICGAIDLFADDPPPDAEKAATPAASNQGATPDFYEFHFQVVTRGGKPVEGATVRPWAVSVRNGSFGLSDKDGAAVKTGADGIAVIKFSTADDEHGENRFKHLKKDEINQIAMEVTHPDHPTWSKYIGAMGQQMIELVDSTTVEIQARRRTELAPAKQLYPMLSAVSDYSDWSAEGDKLVLHRVDLSSDQPWRWLRLVHVPEKGPAWFSEMIDLKQHKDEGKTIAIEVPLKLGVRVVGRLADAVPRPVKNGHVVANIVHGNGFMNTWRWMAMAEIAEDGTFELNSLPADENLQLNAICDGWVSRSPTADEVGEYAKKHWHELSYQPTATFIYPHLVRLEAAAAEHIELPMDPTATCEVTVVDQNNAPIADADVHFWPNQFFFDSGSNIVGSGANSLDMIRDKLKLGKSERLRDTFKQNEFGGKTDADGKVTIANLPAGQWSEDVGPRDEWFNVGREGYTPIANSPNPQLDMITREPNLIASLTPGKQTRVTIKMKKKPAGGK